MNALIVAGGYGTRIRPYSYVLPKPLLPIANKPVLQLLLEHLSRYDVQHVYLSVNYLADLIRTYFEQPGNVPAGMQVTFLTETAPLGTAGPVRHVRDWTGPLLVMNGDLLTNVDVDRLLEVHSEHQAALTVSVEEKRYGLPYGVLQLGANGAVMGIKEKPEVSFWINRGIYIADPRVVGYLPADRAFDMPQLIERLLQAGETVSFCPPAEGEFWYDIADPKSYRLAKLHWTRLQRRLKGGSVPLPEKPAVSVMGGHHVDHRA